MAVLIDKNIKELNIISENFEERCLTPNGYDLRIEKIKFIDSKQQWHETSTTPYLTRKCRRFEILTKEVLNMPNNITGEIWIKSSRGRAGLHISPGYIEAGYKGKLVIGVVAFVRNYKLSPGDKFAQVVFHETVETPEKLYSERSGNFQNQRDFSNEKKTD